MKVRWTEPAAQDLTQICDYLSERGNSGVARRAAISIVDTVGSLAQFPERGRVGRKTGTRELILPNSPYVAIYRVENGAVEVLRVLHGAQRWPPASEG